MVRRYQSTIPNYPVLEIRLTRHPNVGEVLPKAVSVLAQSTLTKAVEKGIRKMSRMENQELHLECFLFIQHNLFINVYMVRLTSKGQREIFQRDFIAGNASSGC
jgi:hypothetical protein